MWDILMDILTLAWNGFLFIGCLVVIRLLAEAGVWLEERAKRRAALKALAGEIEDGLWQFKKVENGRWVWKPDD